jgi:hypothetical protein
MAEPLTKPPIALPEPLVGLFTMFFRKDFNTIQSKNFRHSGDLHSARARAEEHCTIIDAKLNFVQPLISDLKKEEDFVLAKEPK